MQQLHELAVPDLLAVLFFLLGLVLFSLDVCRLGQFSHEGFDEARLARLHRPPKLTPGRIPAGRAKPEEAVPVFDGRTKLYLLHVDL